MAVRVLSRRNLIALCLLAVAGLSAAAASSYLLFLGKGPVVNPVRRTVERTLARQTGLRISLGELRPAPFGLLVIDGLTAWEDSGKEVLAAEQVAIRLSPWSWLKRRGRLSALVSQVELVRPRLKVSRGADGAWNLSRYFRPGEPGEGWQGELVIREGEVTVQGWHPSLLAGSAATPAEASTAGFRLTEVNGRVSATPQGRTQVRLTGRTELLPGARIAATAGFGGAAPARLDLALNGVELARLQSFLPRSAQFGQFLAGRGDLQGALIIDGALPRLISAEVTVRDAVWQHPSLTTPFSAVVGQFTLQGDSVVISQLGFDFLETRWTAQGRVNDLDDPSLDVKLTGENASLPALAQALPASLKGTALNGRATLELTARGEWRSPLLSGFLRLNEVSFTAPGGVSAVSDLSGTVEFAGDGLRTRHLTARIGGGRVSASGEVRDWRRPHGSVRLHLEGVPSEELRRIAPAEVAARLRPLTGGRLSGTLELQGALADPAVRGRMALLGAQWAGLPVETAEVEGAYAQGRLNLERVAVVAAGGRLEATATASELLRGKPRYAFSGRLNEADLASLAQAAGLSLPVAVGGRISALFTGGGEGLEWDQLAATGTVSLSGVRIGEERLTTARAGFTVSRGEVAVDYFTASSPDGRLSGYGRRTADGRLSGTLSGQGVQLSALAQYIPGMTLDGSADILAELGGTEDDPQLSGEFTLFSPSFRRQAFTDGRGRFRLTRRELVLEGMEVHRAEGSLQASGTVSLGPEYPLDLTLTVGALPADTVLALAGVQAALSGTTDGAFVLRGPARTAVVTGQVALAAGRVAGFPYTRAAARFRYADGALEIDRLEVEAEGAAVTGEGRLVGQELDLRVAAERLDLARLPLPGAEEGAWRGTGSFQGTVRGNLRQPVLEGEVAGAGVAYRAYAAETLKGTLRYQDGRFFLKGVEVEQGGGRYFVSGEIEPRTAQLDLRLRLDQGEVENLLQLASLRSSYRIAGKVTGILHVWGRFPNPSARLIAETGELRLGGWKLSGDVDLALRDGEVTINRLRMGEVEGEGLLVAVGRLGRTSVEVEARLRRMDIRPLAAFFGAQAEVAGQADADLVVKGRAADPWASLDVTVTGARVNGMPLSTVRGRAVYSSGAINLEEVVMASGDRRLTATGAWPLPSTLLSRLGLEAEEQAWNLRLAMDQGDMGLLSLVVPALRLSGPGSLWLRLTGPADAPQVDGEIVAAGVTVNHPALGGEITGLRGRVQLGLDGVRTQELIGFYKGGEARLSGRVGLAGLRVRDLDLALTGRDIHYQSPVFEAWLDVDTTVRGPLEEAVIAGQAVLRRSTLTLGAKSGPRRVTWDPALDLTVTSREDMRIVTADRSVDARAYGTLALRGRLSKPTFTGEAEASRGTIVYLNTPFRVTRGQAVFAAYRGILPTLDVTAEAVVPLTEAPAVLPADATGGGGTRTTLKVKLSVTGPAEKLALNLSSEPPLSQAEIVAALSLPGDITRIVAGQGSGGREAELFRMAEQELSHRVFSGLEVAVADALQLDQLSLAPRFREKNVQLHVGKYLVDNVYLTYTRTMDLEPWETIGLEYRIRYGLTFTTSYDNRGELKWGIEARHRF
ncbi:MAG: translocation/assembly module TamB domain-containing protein [Bacillota bacterium]|nr:translocation/assembly module TamB domain-containing protein [Bacillota bacterium]